MTDFGINVDVPSQTAAQSASAGFKAVGGRSSTSNSVSDGDTSSGTSWGSGITSSQTFSDYFGVSIADGVRYYVDATANCDVTQVEIRDENGNAVVTDSSPTIGSWKTLNFSAAQAIGEIAVTRSSTDGATAYHYVREVQPHAPGLRDHTHQI